MHKNIAIVILASASLAGCGKDDEPTTPVPAAQAQFVIDGVRDVSVDSAVGSNILPLAISRAPNSSVQEVVTLTAPDLPAGFSIAFNPASGTPSFTSTATFSYDYSGNGGSFPAKIVGTSASGSKTYSFNVSAPVLSNGWALDGEIYNSTSVTTTISNNVAYIRATINSGPGEVLLRFPYQQPLPTAASTTLNIVSNPVSTGQVGISVEDRNYVNYNATGTGSPVGTLMFQNGKYSFRCSNVEIDRSSGAIKKRLNCKFSQ